MRTLEDYKDYIDRCFRGMDFSSFDKKEPLNRYHTFKYCFDFLNKLDSCSVLEMGTSRSFVDGRFPGCNSDNTRFWEPNNPEKWDFGAGCFTYLCAEQVPKCKLTTLDLISSHIKRSRHMTQNFKNINYIVSPSERYLKNLDTKQDLIYMDTGDMTPIEPVAQLHLREAKLIVERDLIKPHGLILIDDVRNPTPKKFGETSNFGKAKYSIPYLLENGFELVVDEYQVILRKK